MSIVALVLLGVLVWIALPLLAVVLVSLAFLAWTRRIGHARGGRIPDRREEVRGFFVE